MAVILAAKRLRPKTYSIAIYLVIFVLVVQVAALISIFYFRHIVLRSDLTPVPVSVHEIAATTKNTPIASTPAPESEPAPAATPAPASETESLRVLPLSPARLAIPEHQDNRAEIMRLNDEASRYRRQGDFKLAEASLLKAEELDSKESITLTSMAMLMEAEDREDRARAYWERIIDLGPGTGNAYTLAREQILVIDSKMRRQDEATAANALFIDHVDKTYPDPENKNAFLLRITLTASKDQESIDPGKVLIKLYFYEKMPDETIVPSTGKIKVAFEGAVQNWSKDRSETLMATYSLPADLALSNKHEYYGYMLRIFYDGKLQDEKAEPENLLRFFPLTTPSNQPG